LLPHESLVVYGRFGRQPEGCNVRPDILLLALTGSLLLNIYRRKAVIEIVYWVPLPLWAVTVPYCNCNNIGIFTPNKYISVSAQYSTVTVTVTEPFYFPKSWHDASTFKQPRKMQCQTNNHSLQNPPAFPV